MFWLGLLVGIIIGSIITTLLIRRLMFYIGEHPEIIEDIVDKATRTFTDVVVDELQKKLDKIKKSTYTSYTSNPFNNTVNVNVGMNTGSHSHLNEI